MPQIQSVHQRRRLTCRPHGLTHVNAGVILIALTAAGVGVWDADIRAGLWKPPGRVRFPVIPGTDGAGIVAAKGPRVRRFNVGDRVYAYEFGNRKGGFYAEYVCVS